MSAARTRREPPAFRRVEVRRVEPLTPRMIRLTLGGSELAALEAPLPAASVRLLVASPGADVLAIPEWNGNEFLLHDGARPVIRTFTPRRLDRDLLELELDVVVHESGIVSHWVQRAEPGDEAAVSGPGRGYAVAGDADAFLIAGDETAIPAISQLLEVLPHIVPVAVIVEVVHPDARLELPAHPSATVEWHDLPPGSDPGEAIVTAIRDSELSPDVRVWAAGEAGAMQRIRWDLFGERKLPRSQATVRGYWKRGRASERVSADDDR